jgi:hypothetical protein
MKKYKSRMHLKIRTRQRLSFKAMMAICSSASLMMAGLAGLNVTSEKNAIGKEDSSSSLTYMRDQKLVNEFSIPEPVVQTGKTSTSVIFFQNIKPLNKEKTDHEE